MTALSMWYLPTLPYLPSVIMEDMRKVGVNVEAIICDNNRVHVFLYKNTAYKAVKNDLKYAKAILQPTSQNAHNAFSSQVISNIAIERLYS